MASAFGADATLRRRLRAGLNAAAAGRRAPWRQARPNRKNTRNRNTSKKKRKRPARFDRIGRCQLGRAPSAQPAADRAACPVRAPRRRNLNGAQNTFAPMTRILGLFCFDPAQAPTLAFSAKRRSSRQARSHPPNKGRHAFRRFVAQGFRAAGFFTRRRNGQPFGLVGDDRPGIDPKRETNRTLCLFRRRSQMSGMRLRDGGTAGRRERLQRLWRGTDAGETS